MQNLISIIVSRAFLECLAANQSSKITPGKPLQIYTSPEVNTLKKEIVGWEESSGKDNMWMEMEAIFPSDYLGIMSSARQCCGTDLPLR